MNTKTDCPNCKAIQEKYDLIKIGFDLLWEMHHDYHDWKEGKKDHSDYTQFLLNWSYWMVPDFRIEYGESIKGYKSLMRIV